MLIINYSKIKKDPVSPLTSFEKKHKNNLTIMNENDIYYQ